MNKFLCFIMIAIVLSACTEPLVTIPGGRLKGEVASPLASWDAVDDVVQLEMQPTDPYSVNVWAVTTGGQLYVGTGNTRWAVMLSADPAVRFKSGGKVYELTAETVHAESELAAIRQAYADKYDYTITNDGEDMRVYRLANR